MTSQYTQNSSTSTEFAPLAGSEPLPALFNELLPVQRLAEHAESYYEIKDPSIVQLHDGNFMMYASVGNSVRQEWKVGRFIATQPQGPWQEISPVIFRGISGPQLCAPAVTYEMKDGAPLWKMYIQTACFEENGIIVLATSTDGEIFDGQPNPLASRETIEPEHQSSVVGVYDAGISEVKSGNEELLCMLFSGYRRVGCGDVYASYRHKNSSEQDWSPARRLLAQEDVPFHNHPQYEHFEWGLEGAKLVQLGDECFMMIGVCFLPKPKEYLGTRQRVFFAAAPSIQGPFTPICTPFEPTMNQGRAGENGHPDTMLTMNNDLWIIYQERYGEGCPWHLRVARYDLDELKKYFDAYLFQSAHQPLQVPETKPSYEQNYNSEYLQHCQT